MLKPLTIICLNATAIPVIGALLWAQGAAKPSAVRSAPQVLAMQEAGAGAASQESASRSFLSNMGWIGVMVKDAKPTGAHVDAVFPGGPAAFAGVRVGDVLVRIGTTDVHSTQEAEAAIERLTPQQQTVLTVERNRKTAELKVIPGSLAEFQQEYVKEMLRRDPRDPKYAKHHGVSQADMSAELVRRLFEQNERLDRSLNEIAKEVHALRKQVAALQK
jgi:prefoldin subunit 5